MTQETTTKTAAERAIESTGEYLSDGVRYIYDSAIPKNLERDHTLLSIEMALVETFIFSDPSLAEELVSFLRAIPVPKFDE